MKDTLPVRMRQLLLRQQSIHSFQRPGKTIRSTKLVWTCPTSVVCHAVFRAQSGVLQHMHAASVWLLSSWHIITLKGAKAVLPWRRVMEERPKLC